MARNTNLIRGHSRLAAVLFMILFWIGFAGLAQAPPVVDIRVVSEEAPPGGLAVILVELTEAANIRSGQFRFSVNAPDLFNEDEAVLALFGEEGDLDFSATFSNGVLRLDFLSQSATFGSDPELPLLAFALPVLPTAPLGASVGLEVDLPNSFFIAPDGQTYAEEVKPGTFTVGGFSVTDIAPFAGMVASGSVIRIEGVGFQAGLDVNIQDADISVVRFESSSLLEVVLGQSFTIEPTTRFRLRNPDDTEEFTYPAIFSALTLSENAPPVAQDDAVVIQEDNLVEIPVLENDSDPDQDPLSVVDVTLPSHGTATLLAPDQIRYTPESNFFGHDQFSYSISDGKGGTSGAVVSVDVVAVNDAPLARADQVSTPQGQPVNFSVLENDEDVDGDPLNLILLSEPGNGTLFQNADQTLTFSPQPKFSGMDSFLYQISDGDLVSPEVQVSIEVTPLNQPPVAVDDVAQTIQDMPVLFSPLQNDFDPDGDAIAILDVTDPEVGSVETAGPAQLRYIPAPGFVGQEIFGYRIQDGQGALASGQINVVVTPSQSQLSFFPTELALVSGTSEVLELRWEGSGPPPVQAVVSVSAPDVLEAPQSVAIGPDSGSGFFRVSGLSVGIAVVQAVAGDQKALIPVTIQAGSNIQIPVFENGPEAQVGLAITNLGDSPAGVRLRGFPTSADSSPSVETEVQVEVKSQESRLLSRYDPLFESFQGWIEGSSESKDVAFMFLNLQSGRAGFAGSSESSMAKEFFLPLSPSADASDFEFSLINPHVLPAQIQMQWVENGGGVQLGLELPPLDSFFSSFRELFPLPAGSGLGSGYLRISSSLDVVAFQQWAQAESLLGMAPPNLTENSGQVFIPQVLSGQGWSTELTLINSDAQEAEISIEFVAGGPNTAQQQGSEPELESLQLQPGEERRVRVADLFVTSSENLNVASLQLEVSTGVLVSARVDQVGGLATTVPALTSLGREVAFAQVVSGQVGAVSFFTGLALHNPNGQPTLVTVEMVTPEGELKARTSFTLGANQRLSKVLSVLLPGAAPQIGGHLRILSQFPIAMVVLFGDNPLTFLTPVAGSSR